MVIQRIRSFVVAEALLTLPLAQIGRAQQPQAGPVEKPPQPTSQTLMIGTTTLRLGMSKDSVIPALEIQYGMTPRVPDRRYTVMGKSGAIGFVDFNAQGSLVAATKVWTPESRPYGEGEIGRILVTLIAGLVIDGNSACSVNTSQSHSVEINAPSPPVPRYLFRDATIECGHKRIRISTTTHSDGTDSMQINEEIGNPEEKLFK